MIRQHYPRAWQHLQNAMRTRGKMVRAWNAALDDHLVDDMVVTDRDGTGRIIVYADWPPGRQDELTGQFRACIDELWAVLGLARGRDGQDVQHSTAPSQPGSSAVLSDC